MADTLPYTSLNLVAQFRVKAAEAPNPRTRRSIEQAIDTFERYATTVAISSAYINESTIGDWVSFLFSNGYSCKTIGYYLNILSALYGKISKAYDSPPADIFSGIRKRLAEVSPLALEISSDTELFNKLRRLVLCELFPTNPLLRLAKDIVLFSLYNGGLGFDRIAAYRKDQYTGSDDAVLAIITRYSRPKNKYLFPLNQSERTPRQLAQVISGLFADVLRYVGIDLSEYTNAVAADLWATVAAQCGIAAGDIAGCITDVSETNPLYSFVIPNVLSPEQKSDVFRRVSRILTHDPENWYAMQFRPHVDYDKIKTRLQTAGITFSKTFYPMEEIVRRVSKKIIRQTRPVIPGLLFFKSKAKQLPGLYYRIGDLAWGYRSNRDIHSPYAVIPDRAIEAYEKAVGQFADSIEAYPDGTLTLHRGDQVEITSGEFSGHLALFEKEVKRIDRLDHTLTRLTYRLRLAGIEQYNWTVELDPRQLRKVTTPQLAAQSL